LKPIKKTTDIEENPIKLEEITKLIIVDRNVLAETDKKTSVLNTSHKKPQEIPLESEKETGITWVIGSLSISVMGGLSFWTSLQNSKCHGRSDGRKNIVAGILSNIDSVSTHIVPKYTLDMKFTLDNKEKNIKSVLSSDFDDPIKTKFSSIDSMENLNKIYNLYTDIMEKTHYSHSINKIITQMIDSFQRKISD
jgi:hypothetical protein